MSILKMQYPINRVLIIFLLMCAFYGAIGYFAGPWWALGYMAAKELILILVDAYRTQRFLDAFSKKLDQVFNTATAMAKANQNNSVDPAHKE